MRKAAFRIKHLLALVAFAAIMFAGYLHFNKEHFANQVLDAFRQELKTDLAVGSVDLSLFSAFPNLQAQLTDVRLKGVETERDLLRAHTLTLDLSPWQLITGDVRINALAIYDGNIAVQRLSDGTLSLNIFIKSKNADAPGTNVSFDQVELHNVGMYYIDPVRNQDVAFTFDEALISGDLTNDVLKIDIDGGVLWDHIGIGDEIFVRKKPGAIKANLNIDLKNRFYEFINLKTTFGENDFEVRGSIRGDERHQYLNLDVEHTNGRFAELLTLLSPHYRAYFDPVKIDGHFQAQGIIKGRMSPAENPRVEFDFHLTDGSLQSKNGAGTVEALACDATFSNGMFRRVASSVLQLDRITGHSAEGRFESSATIRSLNDPTLDFEFTGPIPIGFITDYAMPEYFAEADGALHFNDLRVNDLWLENMDFTDLDLFFAKCSAIDIVLSTGQGNMQLSAEDLTLNQGILEIDNFKFEDKHNQFIANGTVERIGETLESGDLAYLNYAVDVVAGSLNLDEFTQPSANNHISENSTGHGAPQLVSSNAQTAWRFPKGQLKLDAKHLTYGKIKTKNFKGTANTTVHEIEYQCAYEGMQGTVKADGVFTSDITNDLTIKLLCNDIDVNRCFDQFDNFNQKVITKQHLRGRLDGQMLVHLQWDEFGNLRRDLIDVIAGISLKNGALVKFGMLETFSNYIHHKDLQHIKFQQVNNYIQIKNGNVYIPGMFIQSNAANLSINGVHTLDNQILYNIKLNAGQIVANKLKQHNPRLSPIPARKEGTFNMHYTIQGTVKDYTYGTNRAGVNSSFAQSEKMKHEIRAKLREVFGQEIEIIEPLEWQNIPEYDLEETGEDEFLEFEGKKGN